MNVLHILDHSLPYVTDYSLRSRYIIKLQKDLGIKPLAITSPHHEISSNPVELIEGVFHYRTPLPEDKKNRSSHCPFINEKSLVLALNRGINQVVANKKINLIHVHSPFLNGFAALEICRQEQIPLLYEIRDVIDERALNHKQGITNPAGHAISKNLEIFLCRQAGAVVVTREKIRKRIIRHGVPGGKIYMVPNGEDISLLQPIQKDEEFINKYNLHNSPVLGFIGSFFHHEGVDCLLQAFLKIHEKFPESKLLLMSDRDQTKKIPPSCRDISGHIIYVGQVKQKDIQRYYSLIDILVYPQLKKEVTDKFASQKTLEAMAMGKAIVASDTSGLRELIVDKKTGLFFKAGDISDLTGKCLKLIMNKYLRQTIGQCAHQQIKRDRKWLRVLAQYLKVYKILLTH